MITWTLVPREMINQNLLIEYNGVKVVSTIPSFIGLDYDSYYGIICVGLQPLGNVSLTRKKTSTSRLASLNLVRFLGAIKVQTQEN